MSLFIGKDNNGNALLHTTNTVNDSSSMKNGILVNTMFHTSLPYVQQVYKENIPTYRTAIWSQRYYSYYFTAQLSNTLIDTINQGYVFDIIISTVNSGHKRIRLDFCSTFDKSGAPLTDRTTYSASPYAFGPNNDVTTWAYPYSSTPSYTNRFVYLKNANVRDNHILWGADILYPLDSIDGDIATVLVYNFSTTGVLNKPSSISEVKINNSEFKISSNLGTIDLVNFSPVRLIDYPDADSFNPMHGSINIKPYSTSVSSPVTWEINASNYANVFIKKTGINNVSEIIVGNSHKNLIQYNIEDISYSISTNKNTNIVNLNRTLPTNSFIGVFNTGIFNNGYYTDAVTSGNTLLLGNNSESLLTTGFTYRSSNGVEVFGYYFFSIVISNNNLQLKVRSYNDVAQPMDTGTFYGTIKVLYFNYI